MDCCEFGSDEWPFEQVKETQSHLKLKWTFGRRFGSEKKQKQRSEKQHKKPKKDVHLLMVVLLFCIISLIKLYCWLCLTSTAASSSPPLPFLRLSFSTIRLLCFFFPQNSSMNGQDDLQIDRKFALIFGNSILWSCRSLAHFVNRIESTLTVFRFSSQFASEWWNLFEIFFEHFCAIDVLKSSQPQPIRNHRMILNVHRYLHDEKFIEARRQRQST